MERCRSWRKDWRNPPFGGYWTTDSWQGKSSQRAAWLAALVVVLLAVAGGVAFLALGGEEEAKAQTVRFQAPTDNGPDPFTAPADEARRRRS